MNVAQQRSSELMGRLLAELSRDSGIGGLGGRAFDVVEDGMSLEVVMESGYVYRLTVQLLTVPGMPA